METNSFEELMHIRKKEYEAENAIETAEKELSVLHSHLAHVRRQLIAAKENAKKEIEWILSDGE